MKKQKSKKRPTKPNSRTKKGAHSNKQKPAGSSWRQFEYLVTRIEHALAPKGATVKSPDLIVDKLTGQLREVDASIRFKAGTSEFLITIECRDRIKIEDTTWIEQLATKQTNIGATKTIAVTSNSFTLPAIKKAKFYGIEIRKVTKIDLNSISKWITVNHTQYNYNIVDFGLNIDVSEDNKEKVKQELSLYGSKFWDVDFCTSYKTEKKITLRKILEQIMLNCREQIDKVEIPEIGHTEKITINSKIPKGEVYVTTAFGKFDLIALRVGFTLYKHEERTMKQVSSFTYSNEEKDLVKGIEFEIISSKGTKELLTVHTDINDGTTKTNIWNEANEKHSEKL